MSRSVFPAGYTREMGGGVGLAALAALLFLVVAVAAYAAWFHSTGWESSTFHSPYGAAHAGAHEGAVGSPGGASGPAPGWTPKGGKPVSNLRFRDATFSFVTPAGKTVSRDVTANLNAMAAAFGSGPPPSPAGGGWGPPAVLRLSGPVNPFSFKVAGVNDFALKGNEARAQELGRQPASLTCSVKTLGASF